MQKISRRRMKILFQIELLKQKNLKIEIKYSFDIKYDQLILN